MFAHVVVRQRATEYFEHIVSGAVRTLAPNGDLGNELPPGARSPAGLSRGGSKLDPARNPLHPRESAPKPRNGNLRSGTGLKGLPAITKPRQKEKVLAH